MTKSPHIPSNEVWYARDALDMLAFVSDLYIDGAMLERVRSNLASVTDLLSRPARRMSEVDGRAMGVPELEQRMDDFGDEWEYGISKLGEFSESAVDALDQIKEGFEQADDDLANALNEAKS